MEPRVHYTITRDGVEIAYSSAGEGIPLVTPPPAAPWSDIQREWQIPEWRHWYEHLTDFSRIVRYDGRGSGRSQRDIASISLETELADLEAVVDALDLRRFALFGVYYGSFASIAYALKHPDRVTHLVLWCGVARGSDPAANRTSDVMRTLLDADYPLFTETMAHQVFGWEEGDSAHRLAMYMHDAATPDVVKLCWAMHEDVDLWDELPKLSMPVLLLHRRELTAVTTQQARELAAQVPGSRLVFVEGKSLAPYIGDMEPPLQELAQFLGVDAHPHSMHYSTGQSAGFRVIMFTDIEGSTATTQMVGDARAQEMVRSHNDIVRRALHSFDGTEVKHTGDGIMASFTSAVASIECAIAIQRRFTAQSLLEQDWPSLAVRIGINAGEPVTEGGDLFGTAVQIASRICTAAEPRQIMVSDVVRQLVAGKGFLFSGRGETELRGLEEPLRLFEVRWHEGD